MIWQISLDYNALPDVRTLTLPEIRFYYDGLRYSLLNPPTVKGVPRG